MGRKRMPGLRKRDGIWHINGKVICGRPIYKTTGESDLQKAEAYVAWLTEEIRKEIRDGVRPKRTFRDASTRYLKENMHLSSIADSALHIKALDPFIGQVCLHNIHDGTLQPFKDARYEEGVKATTINRALEVVRRILNLATRKWRHNCSGLTWLHTAPLITMEKEHAAAKPFTLSWDVQRKLFKRLPDHLANMALYKVNTGSREREVCQLQWNWEVPVPALGRSVFVIPGEHTKNGEDRLVVLNDVAWSVVEGQRGNHPQFVFVYRSKTGKVCRPVGKMNNTAWKKAWRSAELPVTDEYKRGVHNLRHTFGRRLRSAGVPVETRKVLMGHTNGDITTHYSEPELMELLDAVNSVLEAQPGKNRALTLLEVKSGSGCHP